MSAKTHLGCSQHYHPRSGKNPSLSTRPSHQQGAVLTVMAVVNLDPPPPFSADLYFGRVLFITQSRVQMFPPRPELRHSHSIPREGKGIEKTSAQSHGINGDV